MKTKILILLIILCLGIGVVSAFNVDSLKTIDNYNDFEKGCSTYITNGDRYLYVEKATSDYKNDWFTTDGDLSVSEVGDNIYYFEYPLFELWGYEEIVMFDGEPYLISINQCSELSPGEKTLFLEDLKEFNKVNNLEPIAV